MATVWSAEQVLALAPDAGSSKSGKELAVTKKWKSLGAGEEILWGECQGSGSSPYQTKISLPEPAFHCSCPSRKFPCKHAIGLFLLWAGQPASFTQGDAPAWVASWLEGRSKRAEQKAQKVKEQEEKRERGEPTVDLAAQKKREQARWAKVNAGIDDLELWMGDLVRHGLTSLQSKSSGVWEEQARRLVDAQAPGLARRLRQIGDLPLSGEGWQGTLLERLAKLQLVVEGNRRLATLSPEVQAELRAIIGIPVDQNEVRSSQGVRDVWQVVGQRVEVEDRLRAQRTWLLGRESGRVALVLDFAHGNSQGLDTSLTPGFQVEAELAFFPGSVPMRALVKERFAPPEALTTPKAHPNIRSAYAAYANTLSQAPWLEVYPLVLNDVTLALQEETWFLRDSEGVALPLSSQFEKPWELLGKSGGQPLILTGEFDGETLNPLAFWMESSFQPITAANSEAESSSRGMAPLDISHDLNLFWSDLSASALVGVERRPVPEFPPTSPLALLASGLRDLAPSSRLLSLAAMTTLYGQVGRKPAALTASLIPPSPLDDRPECSAEPARRLSLLLDGQHFEFLQEWLGLLATAGQRLPGAWLAELLTKARQDVQLRGPLAPVLGNRGRWLAGLNPHWSFVAGGIESEASEELWQTGSRQERRQALRALRAADPARGLELLSSTWKTESAEDRAAFVEALEIGLSMADEPFLEAGLDDKSKGVRSASAALLRLLPESRLSARMIERVQPLLTFQEKTSPDGETEVILSAVSPPEACDKAMIRDGMEPKPPHGVGERTWWLQQVVAGTPSVTWRQPGRAADFPARLLQGVRKHQAEWNNTLWAAWTQAAVRVKDKDWALALLANLPSDDVEEEISSLLAILPAIDRDTFLREQLRSDPGPLNSKHPAFTPLNQVESPLGVELAREVLSRVRITVDAELDELMNAEDKDAGRTSYGSRRFDYHIFPFITRLAQFFPPELIGEAEFGFPSDVPPSAYFSNAYQRFLDALRFRHEMHEEFRR